MKNLKCEVPSAKRRAGWLAALLLALPALLHGTMKFAVDYAGFRSSSKDSTLIEIYHSVPYDQLHYQAFGDTIYAEYQVRLALTDLASGKTVTHALFEPAVIPSFEEAKKRQLSIAHNFSLNLAPGRYLMQFDIRDTQDFGSVTETLVVRDISQSPGISDLIIGDNLVRGKDSALSVLPRPSRAFGPAGPREMYIYLDGYDFTGDTLSYDVLTDIVNDSGRVVKSLRPERQQQVAPQIHEVYGLTTQGLKTGTYQLRVTLRDVPTGKEASALKSFFVVPEAKANAVAAPERLSPEEQQEYHDVHYLASDAELRKYKSLKATGKEEWLRRFWEKRDFRGYLDRLATVDARFSWGNIRGRDTDEGKIFLKYGEPDEIEGHTMIEHAKPHEHWRYYKPGYHFIFVDVRGEGRMRLVYSNSDTDRKDPNWENLVDPLELDELQR